MGTKLKVDVAALHEKDGTVAVTRLVAMKYMKRVAREWKKTKLILIFLWQQRNLNYPEYDFKSKSCYGE